MTVEPSPPAPAWTRTFWPGLDVGDVDQGLPRGQRHQRHGGGLLERQRGRLEGDVVSVDGDVLGEGADAQVARSGVDLVADLEAADVGADLGDDAGEVVAEDERPLVLDELLELAVADHLVQRVDAGRPDVDQDVAGPDGRQRDVGRLAARRDRSG